MEDINIKNIKKKKRIVENKTKLEKHKNKRPNYLIKNNSFKNLNLQKYQNFISTKHQDSK